MAFNPTEISNWDDKYLNGSNFTRKIFQLDKNSDGKLSNLQTNSSVRLALLDFYNDIKHYKDAVKNIMQVQNTVTSVQRQSKTVALDENAAIDSIAVRKYSLLQPNLFTPTSSSSMDEMQKSHSCCRQSKTPTRLSEISMQTCSINTSPSKSSSKYKHKNYKKPVLKTILVANPSLVEFRNYESTQTQKKTVIVRNIDTKLARFKIASRPLRSKFTVFIESARKRDKEHIAPGMFIKLHVIFRCDSMTEPEEVLVLEVKDGAPVEIKMMGRRDPPVLRAIAVTYSYLTETKYTESSTSSSDLGIHSSECSKMSSFYINVKDVDDSKVSSCASRPHTSFDCRKCFVGEFLIQAIVMKNFGGQGRFFLMSELDWCSEKIEDITTANLLIVPPFAVYPSYFALQREEEITLHVYFYPDSYGLQVDELHVIGDNCSWNTIEIIGDGIVFEPQSLEFDKNVKYQWFESKSPSFCTIKYLDLGAGYPAEVLRTTFFITSKCELDVFYRWEICKSKLCPAEYKNTVGRKDFPLEQITIEPSTGIFEYKSINIFNVLADMAKLPADYYKCSFRLIIEDIPYAAVSKKHNFDYEEATTKRRLSQDSVDLIFENIEVRMKCLSVSFSQTLNAQASADTGIQQTLSITDLTKYPSDIFLTFDLDKASTISSSTSDDVCRLIKGYGTCNCCQTTLFSTATLRPEKPLFLGVETKFTAVLRNVSPKRLKYWWSNPVGADHTKLNVQIDPKFEHVLPNSEQMLVIRVLPLETGNISALYISCQFDGINPVILSIECEIRSLCTSLYFPLTSENDTISDTVRIDWNANEYVSRYDKKRNEINIIRKIKEEILLHTITLNTSESLFQDYDKWESEDEMVAESSSNDVKTLKNEDSCGEFYWNEGEESLDEIEALTPYFDFPSYFIKKHFRYLPLVVEIHVVPGKSEKKRVYIENESPITSNFHVKTRNFMENKYESGDDAYEDTNGLASGVFVSVEPIKGVIQPNELLYFDIIASSNTWGIYTDEIEIKIDHLPSYRFWIRIINDESPVVYPICRNSTSKVPKIRFKMFRHGCSTGDKRLLIENRSSIPLYVNWHYFLEEEKKKKEKPFNLILDMFTPFINIEDFLAGNPEFYNEIKRYFSCAFKPYKRKDAMTEIDDYPGTVKASTSSGNICINRKDSDVKFPINLSQIFSSGTKTTESNENTGSILEQEKKKMKRNLETEFHLSIVPYYGQPIYGLFKISPQELFLPPKEKRYVHVGVNTERLAENCQSMRAKACGFIRIPPLFKYKDNVFFRKDGYYLPPAELSLEIDIRGPLFTVQSNRDQRTFEFHTKDFVQQMKNTLEIERNILFTNFDEEILEVTFEIKKPFQIVRVTTQSHIFCKNMGQVHPGESVQITFKCTISTGWLEREKRRYKNKDLTNLNKTINLIIVHRDELTQYHKMYIKVYFPTIKVSTNCLRFNNTCIGEAATLTFEVENLSKLPQWFKIERDDGNGCCDIFKFYPTKALLLSAKENAENKCEEKKNSLTISASFVPKKPGLFKDVVQIASETDGVFLKFTVMGKGC